MKPLIVKGFGGKRCTGNFYIVILKGKKILEPVTLSETKFTNPLSNPPQGLHKPAGWGDTGTNPPVPF
jgi:hypothetical protein